MANKEIPKDAFIVEGKHTTFNEAQMGEAARAEYNKILSVILDSGVDMSEAIQHAENGIRKYFKMYMEKYYPTKENIK